MKKKVASLENTLDGIKRLALIAQAMDKNEAFAKIISNAKVALGEDDA
jgi:hypothetical protein